MWNSFFALASLITFWFLIYSLVNLDELDITVLHPRLIVEIIFFILFLILALVL